MSRNFILTGAPGAGKTSIVNYFADQGYLTVPEAATSLIHELQAKGVSKPWEDVNFINMLVDEQIQQLNKSHKDDVIFYDRSPVCTWALALYLGHEVTDDLAQKIMRILPQYEKKVFFVDNLGFIKNNAVRQISFAEALKFEEVHLQSYKKFGFLVQKVPVASIEQRAKFILDNF